MPDLLPSTLSTMQRAAGASRGDASYARPARKQISMGELEMIRTEAERPAGTGMTYNVWYNKMSGGDTELGYATKTHAKTRCDIARDSGYTRADLRIRQSAGGVSNTTFCCLFFARGCCPKGCVSARDMLTPARSAIFYTACRVRTRLPTRARMCLDAKSLAGTATTWAASAPCFT